MKKKKITAKLVRNYLDRVKNAENSDWPRS